MKEESTTTKPSDDAAIEQSPSVAPDSKDQPASQAAELLKDWSPEIIANTNQEPSNAATDSVIDDPETDQLVSDIAADESDEILAVEDAVNEAENEAEPKLSFRQRLKKIWAKPATKWATAGLVSITIITGILVPSVRYFLLNTAGVRVSSSLQVLDLSSQQPIKNTKVVIGGSEGTTDSEGKVVVNNIRLGKQRLVINKLAFATIDKSITIGFGSNPLGTFELTPTGVQYQFQINDVVSGKPLPKAELTSGQSNAVANDEGKAILTVEQPGEEIIKVQFMSSGYRTDTIEIDANTKDPIEVAMAPERKHVFISKRSGSYDVYSVYVDGKDEKLIVKGTGAERDNDMTLVPHPKDAVTAYVSTRGNQANKDGYLLSNLIMVDENSGDTVPVALSERINIVGWSGDKLIYAQIAEGQSAPNGERYKIMSYDHKTNETKQLAKADHVNDVMLFAGQVYYAPSGALSTNSTQLRRVNVDGGNDQTLLEREVWSIVRVGYEELALSTADQQWFTYQKGAAEPVRRNAAPADQQTRTYIDSPDGKYSVWIDVRDGKGVLIAYELGTKTDDVVAEVAKLTYPVRWINDTTLVYRINSSTESADYVVSIDGGEPRKISDVTQTNGLGITR